jgi:hypothetical protein
MYYKSQKLLLLLRVLTPPPTQSWPIDISGMHLLTNYPNYIVLLEDFPHICKQQEPRQLALNIDF